MYRHAHAHVCRCARARVVPAERALARAHMRTHQAELRRRWARADVGASLVRGGLWLHETPEAALPSALEVPRPGYEMHRASAGRLPEPSHPSRIQGVGVLN